MEQSKEWKKWSDNGKASEQEYTVDKTRGGPSTKYSCPWAGGMMTRMQATFLFISVQIQGLLSPATVALKYGSPYEMKKNWILKSEVQYNSRGSYLLLN